jgi:large subunit ribosomal protein L35
MKRNRVYQRNNNCLIVDGADKSLVTKLERARYQQYVMLEINTPEVRWRFQQGDIDLRQPVYQHLYEEAWKESVYVGRLVQRLETMKIVPDSLPLLHPKVEFRLRFHESKIPSRIKPRPEGWRDTEPGEQLHSSALEKPPRMEIIPHYREWWQERKYTVVMMDLGNIL